MDSGAWDDVSGASLDPKEVVKARLKEVGYVARVDENIPQRGNTERLKNCGDEAD